MSERILDGSRELFNFQRPIGYNKVINELEGIVTFTGLRSHVNSFQLPENVGLERIAARMGEKVVMTDKLETDRHPSLIRKVLSFLAREKKVEDFFSATVKSEDAGEMEKFLKDRGYTPNP